MNQLRWITPAVLRLIVFVSGLVPQIRADVNDSQDLESNESGWVQTNGPYGGYIRALYGTPKGVLFAGTEGAGIFRSMDLGDSWTPVNTGIFYEPGEGFVSVAALAQKGDTLYAGTTGYLYESTDDGDTWHHRPTLQTYVAVSGIVVIGDWIYIGTLNNGVWYSDDDGDRWIPINDGSGHITIRELSRIGTTLVAGTENGVFRKKAGEALWTPINAGFVAQPIDMELSNSARIESGVDPLQRQQFLSGLRVDSFTAMENLLYTSVYMGSDHGLFRSDDEGDSWTRITAKEMTHPVEALATSGTTLYASTFGSGVFRSEDSGDSWTAVNDGLTAQKVSVLLAVSEDTVFVGTLDGGIFRTTDGGNSWAEINIGLTNTSVTQLEVIGKKIYASIGERLFHSVDLGESWQPIQISSRPISYHFAALTASGEKLYVAATRFAPSNVVGGIFQLDEKSNSLTALNTNRELYGINCLEIVDATFYIGTQGQGVFRWRKASASWTNLGLERHFITALAVNEKGVYAGTGRGEIFRWEDAGKPWMLINSADMLGGSISDLKWVGSTLYAASWVKGVFRSANGGNSWTPLNYGLGDTSVMTMETEGTESYIGTYYNGVFQWIEDKKWWKPIGSLRRQVDSLVVLDSFLYAGTVGGGVFKIPIEK